MSDARFGVESLPERIRVKVVVGPDCWPWVGQLNWKGYGRISVGTRTAAAHRVVYEHMVGLVPDGQVLDHLCHTRDTTCAGGNTCPHRRCVNPAHLAPSTTRQNVLSGRGVTAHNARQNACVNGHPLSGANLYVCPDGVERKCRQCNREATARYKAKLAALKEAS